MTGSPASVADDPDLRDGQDGSRADNRLDQQAGGI
jgi:hypothetical protein